MEAILRMLLGNAALDRLGERAIVEISDALANDYEEEILEFFEKAQELNRPNPSVYAFRQTIRAMLRDIT